MIPFLFRRWFSVWDQRPSAVDTLFCSCFRPFLFEDTLFSFIIFQILYLIFCYTKYFCLIILLNSSFLVFQEIFDILKTFYRKIISLHQFKHIFLILPHFQFFPAIFMQSKYRINYWNWFQIKDFMFVAVHFLKPNLQSSPALNK